MTDPDDILARRLRMANPVPPDQPVLVDRQIPELLEAAMSVRSDTIPHSPKRPNRWRLAAVAAVVLAIAATIGGFVAIRDGRQIVLGTNKLGQIEAAFDEDKQVLEAVKVLKDQPRYQKILSGKN